MTKRTGWVGATLAVLFPWVLVAAGCADSHPPAVRCASDVECGPGTICAGASSGTGRCLETCSFSAEARCSNGAACRPIAADATVCWDGRSTEEGEISTPGGIDCAFGLNSTPDYAAEPLVWHCEPVCNADEDCRAGETCIGGRFCGVPCEAPGAAPCVGTDICWNGLCVSERRMRRADCDGNGNPDCGPSLQCDSSAIGGCALPPPGEE